MSYRRGRCFRRNVGGEREVPVWIFGWLLSSSLGSLLWKINVHFSHCLLQQAISVAQRPYRLWKARPSARSRPNSSPKLDDTTYHANDPARADHSGKACLHYTFRFKSFATIWPRIYILLLSSHQVVGIVSNFLLKMAKFWPSCTNTFPMRGKLFQIFLDPDKELKK